MRVAARYELADPDKITQLVELYTDVSPLTLKRKIDRTLAAMPGAIRPASGA